MPKLIINTAGTWKPLQPGDKVDIIAPASIGSQQDLPQIEAFLKNWGLIPQIPDRIFGEDLLCANTDPIRLAQLKEALYDSDSKAIWCLRGGYGCARLIPDLLSAPRPEAFKYFIGFSDATALHLLFDSIWNWPTIHGPGARQVGNRAIDDASISIIHDFLLGRSSEIVYDTLEAINSKAASTAEINASIIGGNLCLLECSLGTPWQIKPKGKILLIEELNERAYKVDRSLEHLLQSNIIHDAAAIIFGDFLFSDTEETQKINAVLHRFAENSPIPAYQLPGVGHGPQNFTIPLRVPSRIVSA